MVKERICASCEVNMIDAECDLYDDEDVMDEHVFDEKCNQEEAECVYVELTLSRGTVNAVMDTGAKSFWVDKKWFMENGGLLVNCESPGASGVDGRGVAIAGEGLMPSFELWGCKFDDVPVRVMEYLPSSILIGVDFWLKHGLHLDMANLCGTVTVSGVEYGGSVTPVKCRSELNEKISNIEEVDAIEQDIQNMDLTEFSENEEHRREMRDMLLEFRDLFQGVGLVKGVEHRILLEPDAVPACCPTRRRSPAEEDAERSEVTKHIKNGIMEPAVSPWAAANVFVPKKSGGLRTTTDFRLLNEMTVSDKYPMEDVRTILDWLSSKRIFSTFDLKDGFFQVVLAEESRPLTAVRTVMGLMQYRRLPQGLKNSPATFQRIVNTVLGDLKGNSVSGFVDDISVGTKTVKEHLDVLRKVLLRIRECGMKLKLSKCQFGKRSVEVLGHEVSNKGIRPSAGHLEAIKRLQEPRNGKELMRFLGLANYFSEFVENFAARAKPLYDVLSGVNVNKKKRKYVPVYVPEFEKRWGQEQRAAWLDLRDELSSPRILVSPDRYAKKLLMTDASGYGVGAVLLQIDQRGKWRPIAFASRKLKGAEVRYTVTEQECLAVVYALRKWRHYLHGGPRFEVVTDHMALRWLMSLREPRGRLARWMVEIQEFDYEISHVPGEKLVVPDCLSRDTFEDERSGCKRCEGEELRNVRELCYLPDLLEILSEQEKELGDLRRYVENNDDFIIDEDGLLCHEGKQKTNVFVPSSLRDQVLAYMHGSTVSGHFGVARTSRRLGSRFWWPQYKRDVEEKVKSCLVCELARASPPQRQGRMAVYHPTRRFEMVAIDIMEISPKSGRGNTKVIVIGDTFTRYAWAYPVADEKSETIARVLLDGWILRYGPPEKLLSDRGKVFIGKLLEHMCRMMGVKKIFTTSYHPQCDGFIERLNRTLCKDLAAFVSCEADWDLHLSMAVFRYNTGVHEATGMTPFKAMFGVDAFDFDAEVGWKTMLDDRDDDEELPERMRIIHDELFRRGMHARAQAAKQYNRALKEVQFEQGDRVLLFYPPGQVEQGRKLRSPWLGPYRVKEKLSPISYMLESEATKEVARVHVNRLRTFSEAFAEVGSPQAGVFPDSRRMALRVIDSAGEKGDRRFKVVSPGRTGFVWKAEAELPEIVVKSYDLAQEDARRWSTDERADRG
jgi:transposase InsO family protein